MTKPSLEEIAAAYKELRTVSLAIGLEAWDQQLEDHRTKGTLHPQALRRQNVQLWKKAKKGFYSLMERLITPNE